MKHSEHDEAIVKAALAWEKRWNEGTTGLPLGLEEVYAAVRAKRDAERKPRFEIVLAAPRARRIGIEWAVREITCLDGSWRERGYATTRGLAEAIVAALSRREGQYIDEGVDHG